MLQLELCLLAGVVHNADDTGRIAVDLEHNPDRCRRDFQM
jgi:hypothetical protein